MEIQNEIKSLASYVTYRQLYDDGKRDTYFVISKFVENVIITQNFYSFGLTEMSEQIRKQFGFDIPDYVIQSSIRRLSYVTRSNNLYIVNSALLPKDNNVISNSIEYASGVNEKLVNDLVKYVEGKKGSLNIEQTKSLIREFCSFLLDNSAANGHSELISAFILEHEKNKDFQAHLMQIKEGAVLFAGLNYNSDISDNSAWKDELIVFVENEILFHLAGYNGSVFKRLADELFALINEMNFKSKTKVIKVRYFEEVSEEIDAFFDKAVDIVEGKDHVTVDNYAMAEIVRGCKSASDVIGKKSQFYTLLRSKMIVKESKKNYYSEEFHEYNLESPEAVRKFGITDDKLRYIKHLNYVNILRQGKYVSNLKKSKYIVLTETGKMLRMASEFSGASNLTPLALNMSVLTNRLWYDLNKGFGASEFPTTFDIVVKSKIVLSKLLTQNVAHKYEEAKQKYIRNEINANQLADSILLLREEVKRPEDIKTDIVEEVLTFITEDKLDIYQSEKELLEDKLNISEKEREALTAVIKLREEENIRIQAEATSRTELLQKINDELFDKRESDVRSQIADFEKRTKVADKKIEGKLKWIKSFILLVILAYYSAVVWILFKSTTEVQTSISLLLSVIPPAISLFLSLLREKRFDFLELYKLVIGFFKDRYTKKVYAEYLIDITKIKELQIELETLKK